MSGYVLSVVVPLGNHFLLRVGQQDDSGNLHNFFASMNAPGMYALLAIGFFGEDFRTPPSRRPNIMAKTIMLPTTEESFDTNQQFY